MDSTIILNNSLFYNFFVKKKYEFGLVLKGWEVKSIRKKRIQIDNSFAVFKKKELWLIGCIINPLISTCNHENISSDSNKKLLINKNEIISLSSIMRGGSFVLIPYKVYWKNNIIKIEVCLCVGKKKHDKRSLLKEKDWKLKNKTKDYS